MTCFDEILDFYNDENRTHISTELWINKFIANLFSGTLREQNYLQIRNCLLLLLNLFRVELPDHYHHKGKSFIELESEEKKSFKKILEQEFL